MGERDRDPARRMQRPLGPGLAVVLVAAFLVAGVAAWFGMRGGDAPKAPPNATRYPDNPTATGALPPGGQDRTSTGYPANPAMPPAQPRTGGGG